MVIYIYICIIIICYAVSSTDIVQPISILFTSTDLLVNSFLNQARAAEGRARLVS